MVKILIVKPSPNSIKPFFSKLTNINKKNGPFDLIICISDLFKNHKQDEDDQIDDLIQNKISIPTRTFFMIGQYVLPKKIQAILDSNQHGEICKNLEYLDPFSITTLKTLGDLRIATFSGVFDHKYFNTPNEPIESSMSETDTIPYHIKSVNLSTFLTKLKSQSQPIDLLLTHSLPHSLTSHSKRLPKDLNPSNWGCSPITDLLKQSKPRYHFSGGSLGEFWEREPWVWDSDSGSDSVQVTRFVNLGEFGNKEKERWFYAFNLTPSHETVITKPTDSTLSPYTPLSQPLHQKRHIEDDEFDSGPNFRFSETDLTKRAKTSLPPQNYVCKICEKPGHWIQECPSKLDPSKNLQDGYVCRICNVPGHRIQQCPMKETRVHQSSNQRFNEPKEIGPSTCWFCLSNPQVTKHLIVSIGSETYVSLPKGQLPDTKSGCPVPGGGHVLIIPIAHYPSLLGLPKELSIPIQQEIQTYQNSLCALYSKYNASMVSFEVVKLTGTGARQGHGHLQVCPIPNELVEKIESSFIDEASKVGIEFEDQKEVQEEGAMDGMSYFRVGLPTGKKIISFIKPNQRLNMQFGRIVLAKVLDQMDRSDWKNCVLNEEDERLECDELKKVFKSFEPKFD
ncbi:uncharacterized protein MELLADRAFT_118092 [Melampsora larici-populina 98AG31]|uniref:CCHC-type domain-containing protein n=1 Tax=Melampsora larici-populina (strain 98AG31 / pathotype 3-4-7) TaxID=747676 RepID=F4S510_MELLP|nr:uncharacterized protein MELLADRAFT_118092 [Melampsora larici-populina 98AG31]EGG00284.1 hypothetical protein MELLADRAFT_118092 [Melampsora larici-populina 98AG31]